MRIVNFLLHIPLYTFGRTVFVTDAALRDNRKPFKRVGILINLFIMKKSLKKLALKKEVISELKLSALRGGHSGCCPTEGALNSCPPPGMQCF